MKILTFNRFRARLFFDRLWISHVVFTFVLDGIFFYEIWEIWDLNLELRIGFLRNCAKGIGEDKYRPPRFEVYYFTTTFPQLFLNHNQDQLSSSIPILLNYNSLKNFPESSKKKLTQNVFRHFQHCVPRQRKARRGGNYLCWSSWCCSPRNLSSAPSHWDSW
jgi:hypothetical protein